MGAHTQEVVVAELVRRMLCGEPLLPLPQASQDLALLAFELDRRGAVLKRVLKLAEAFATDPAVPHHVPIELMSACAADTGASFPG